MKRLFAILLALGTVFTLAACSGALDPYSVTLAAADDDYTESTVAPPSEITFQKLTVCEGDDYGIIIRGIKPDAPEGYVLSVDIANTAEITETTKTVYTYRTDDDGEREIVGEEQVTVLTGPSYRFVVDTAIVNGKKIDVAFETRLSADDRTFDQIVLDKAALDGLGVITKIELIFDVYDAEDDTQPASRISGFIYPYGAE